jgi:putative DNA primase/helicase
MKLVDPDPGPEFLWPNRFDIDWDPTATTTYTDGFLERILPAEECILFYEILGYCLVPDTDFQKAFLLQGPGANGKSKFLELIRKILGKDNCSAIPLHRLESNSFAAYGLMGRLANIHADLSANRLPSSEMFKAIVGGDLITIERKYHDASEAVLPVRLLFSCNRLPRSADNSDGFFRRWILIRFNKANFSKEKDKKDMILSTPLMNALLAERSGILFKAVKAYNAVIERGGFTETERMRQDMAEFRAMTDSLSQWIEDTCLIGPNLKVRQKDLHRLYNKFCKENDLAPLDASEFSEQVQGYEKANIGCTQINGYNYFTGIGEKDWRNN